MYKTLVSGAVFNGNNQFGGTLTSNDYFDLNRFNDPNLTGEYTIRYTQSRDLDESLVNNGVNKNDTYIFDTDSQLGSDRINETTIALKTARNTYVRANRNGDMDQNPDAVTWEEFQVYDQGDGKIGLQTFHDKYVRAKDGLNEYDVDQSSSIDSWEKFQVVDRGGGNIGLKTAHSSYYLRVQDNNSIEQQPWIDDWGTFTPIARNRDIDTLDFIFKEE